MSPARPGRPMIRPSRTPPLHEQPWCTTRRHRSFREAQQRDRSRHRVLLGTINRAGGAHRTWVRTRGSAHKGGHPSPHRTGRNGTTASRVAPGRRSRRDRARQRVGDGRQGDHGVRLWCQPGHPAQVRGRGEHAECARGPTGGLGPFGAGGVRRAHRSGFHSEVDTTAERVGQPWCRLDHEPRAFRGTQPGHRVLDLVRGSTRAGSFARRLEWRLRRAPGCAAASDHQPPIPGRPAGVGRGGDREYRVPRVPATTVDTRNRPTGGRRSQVSVGDCCGDCSGQPIPRITPATSGQGSPPTDTDLPVGGAGAVSRSPDRGFSRW